MADNVAANTSDGLGPTFATDDASGVHWPYGKIAWGADNVQTPVSIGAAALPVQDGGNSITVDAPVATPVFVRLSDGAAALAALPVTDDGGSLTVDNGGTFAVQAAQSGTWNIGTVTTVTTVSAVTGITNWGNLVDNAAFTDGTSRVSVSGYIFDEVAGTALTENDVAAARVDSKRAQVMVVEDATTRGRRQAVDASGNAAVAPKPATSGGLSIGRLISAASTNATSLKASAGQVYTIFATNTNAAVRYLKLYNKASAPTVGTDTPVLTIPIPGNTAGNGIVVDTGGMGLAFATGIAYAVTTGVADSDTGAVAANEIVLGIFYK